MGFNLFYNDDVIDTEKIKLIKNDLNVEISYLDIMKNKY